MPAASRLGDKSHAPADSHGCKSCSHPVTGPAVTGSSDVITNGKPALRLGDTGIHATCCGANTWQAVAGSATVFINGRPAVRQGDQSQHCGGAGTVTEGSPDVLIGDMGGSSPNAIEDQPVHSRVFDTSSMLHNDPDVEGASYQIWTRGVDPKLLAVGTIDNIGRTARVFTEEAQEVEFITGDNEWLTVYDEQYPSVEQDQTDEMP